MDARRRKARAAQARVRTRRDDPEPWLVPLLAGAFVVSGAAGLVHEVVWTRLLGHLFGVSSYAIATVLGAYMAGLALGSALAGARIERWPSPLRAYAWLELGIGVSALAIPRVLVWVEPVYGALWRAWGPSFAAFTALRFAIAGAILLVPTSLMGATLPVLAEALARRDGRRLAPEWLYTANLAGAVLGVAIGGFVLMPVLGTWATLATGAALNAAVAIAVLGVGRERAVARSGARGDAPQAEAELPVSPSSRLAPDLVLSAFASGVLSLATQVAWNRVLAPIVGTTNYAFSSVLLVYLLCLGAGSALASRAGDRATERGDAVAWARSALPLAFLLCAIAMVVSVAIASGLPWLYHSLYGISEAGSLAGLVLRGVITTAIVVLAPVLVAGTALPLTLVAAGAARGRGAGAVVARVYAVNTVGAIAGSLLGGFVLVPALGTQTALLALAAASAATGVALARGGSAHAPRSSARATAVVAAGALAFGFAALPEWNHVIFHVGVFEPGRYDGDFSQVHLSDAGQSVLFHREGRSAGVIVLEDAEAGIRGMRIDGRANASNAPGDMRTQILLAQIPLLLAPRTADVFVVGWGSGVTAGAALQAPVEHVTAVELEPAVVEGSAFFRSVNHDPLSDPRVRLVDDDARHVLLASDATYDVIISEPPHPFVVGVANLFTREFYELAARRLRPDGVFAQWVQTYELPLATYRSILATFLSVFPEAMVFETGSGSDTVLVGSRAPLRLDLDAIAERWSAPATRSELARARLQRPEHLVAAAVLGRDEMRRWASGAPINTDDNMLVEFQAAAGSLVPLDVGHEVAARAAPLASLVRDPERIAADPERRAAYAEAVRRLRRDPDALLGDSRAGGGEAAPPAN